MGQDIIVIDKSDDRSKRTKGWLVGLRATFPHALLANNVHDMVEQILRQVGSGRINRLRIYGHGSIYRGQGGLQGMGDSFTGSRGHQLITVTRRGDLLNRTDLERLRGHFEPDAVVELRGCNVAHGHRGREILRQLSDLWHTRVQAGTEVQYHTPGDTIDNFEGPVVEARNLPGHHSRVHRVR
jgi:hypothetical protein